MRWTDHPRFAGDAWNAHDLWLVYGTYTFNTRCMECSCFMVDVQDMSAPWMMVRTPKTDNNCLSVIEINFPTTSPTA